MNHPLVLLRLGYWVAAIADFIIAILALIPQRMGVPEFVYPMGLMSAVAFSWGVMLILADRRPLERRWVLVPTMLVVFLLGVAVGYALSTGLIPVQQAIFSLVAVAVVLVLLSSAWLSTRSIQN